MGINLFAQYAAISEFVQQRHVFLRSTIVYMISLLRTFTCCYRGATEIPQVLAC
jgi:hypothetical protein